MSFKTKSPAMQAQVDDLAMSMFGRKVSESLEQNICVRCGQTPVFDGTCIDKTEYNISGLCSDCQNVYFKKGA